MKSASLYPWLLIVIIASVLAPLWFGQFYGNGDMRDVYIPLETFFRTEQLAGRLPAWNPDIAWGFPVLASAQIGFFYPPLLLLRMTPIWFYFPLTIFLHLLAAGLGTYFLMRQQGASRPASYLSGLCFTLSGFVFRHITHLNIILALAWLPWQLILARSLSRQANRRHLTWFALSLGLPFLVGHIQIPLLIAMVSCAYYLYSYWQQNEPPRANARGFFFGFGGETLTPRRSFAQPFLTKLKSWAFWCWGNRLVHPVTILVVIALLATGIAAAQLLPTAQLAFQSSRSSADTYSIEQANQYSFPVYHLPTAIFPRFFASNTDYWGKRLELEHGFFIGTIPLLLAALTVYSRWRRHRFFIGLAFVSFLLALGNLSPFRLIGIEPSLWIFSAPARWLLFTTFAGSILAGHGLDLLHKQSHLFRKIATGTALTIIGLTIISNAVLWRSTSSTTQLGYALIQRLTPQLVANNPSDYYLEKLDRMLDSARSSSVSLASPYTALPILILIFIPWLGKKQYLLLTAITAELIIIAATASPTIPWRELLVPPATIQALPDSIKNKQARLITVRNTGDSGAFFTNPDTIDNPSALALKARMLVPLTHAQFQLPGVEWPASLNLQGHNAVLESLREPGKYTITNLERVQELNIAAILVPININQPNLPVASKRVGDINVFTTTAAPRAIDLGNPTAKVSYYSPVPDSVELEVNTDKPTTILVRDTWYPGWHTTVDGEPRETLQLESIFRGVEVSAGRHSIKMKYRPRLAYIGMFITLLTITTCGLAILKRKPDYSSGSR